MSGNKTIKLIRGTVVDGKPYEKGQVLKVSENMHSLLTGLNKAIDYVPEIKEPEANLENKAIDLPSGLETKPLKRRTRKKIK